VHNYLWRSSAGEFSRDGQDCFSRSVASSLVAKNASISVLIGDRRSAIGGSCGVYGGHGTGALTDGGCDTLHGSMPHVADGEDARLR
jgi:hypothetical protein